MLTVFIFCVLPPTRWQKTLAQAFPRHAQNCVRSSFSSSLEWRNPLQPSSNWGVEKSKTFLSCCKIISCRKTPSLSHCLFLHSFALHKRQDCCNYLPSTILYSVFFPRADTCSSFSSRPVLEVTIHLLLVYWSQWEGKLAALMAAEYRKPFFALIFFPDRCKLYCEYNY